MSLRASRYAHLSKNFEMAAPARSASVLPESPSAEFGSGKPARGGDPGPVKHALTAAHRKEARDAKQAAAMKSAKMDVAAQAAARDLSAANVGVVRSSLFDADGWKKEHAAREQRMETTFSKL